MLFNLPLTEPCIEGQFMSLSSIHVLSFYVFVSLHVHACIHVNVCVCVLEGFREIGALHVMTRQMRGV